MGLGIYPVVGLALARDLATDARRLIAVGKDPIDERNAAKAAGNAASHILTFEGAARAVHKELEPSWSNPKHAAQWLKTLEEYVFPKTASLKVVDLTTAHFAEALRPIWLEKPETATRVRQRCHSVMKWCGAHQLVVGNPVDAVEHLLPRRNGSKERVTHQPAMAWRDIPEFVKSSLRGGRPNVSRSLLEFLILTAARSGEVRGMTWNEVDLKTRVWIIPAERMKAKVTHRVPLSERATDILREQRRLHPDSNLVFPALRGSIVSDATLTKFLRDQSANSSEPGRTATAHGFRSSFRDWASENGYPRDLAERALAHTVKNKVEAAYHRTDLLEQRKDMMEGWARHVQ
jgi:integrase